MGRCCAVTKLTVNNCQLCNPVREDVLWQDQCCRIIRVADEDYPGFCRVILQEHAREMTDLKPGQRERLMQAVFATEAALRELMTPDKINLASFGNVVPHLHWHVVPRFEDDRHFPNPVWGTATRPRPGRRTAPPSQAITALLRHTLA